MLPTRLAIPRCSTLLFAQVMSRQVAPLVSPSTQEIKVNLTYSDLTRQLQGPANPFTNRFVESQNMLTGHVQQQTVADFDFAMQERTFRAFGYARDPSSSSVASNGGVGQGIGGTGYVGNVQKALETGGAMVRDPKAPKNNQSFKRKPKGDLSVLEGENAYMGPWAGYEQDDIAEAVEPEVKKKRTCSGMVVLSVDLHARMVSRPSQKKRRPQPRQALQRAEGQGPATSAPSFMVGWHGLSLLFF